MNATPITNETNDSNSSKSTKENDPPLIYVISPQLAFGMIISFYFCCNFILYRFENHKKNKSKVQKVHPSVAHVPKTTSRLRPYIKHRLNVNFFLHKVVYATELQVLKMHFHGIRQQLMHARMSDDYGSGSYGARIDTRDISQTGSIRSGIQETSLSYIVVDSYKDSNFNVYHTMGACPCGYIIFRDSSADDMDMDTVPNIPSFMKPKTEKRLSNLSTCPKKCNQHRTNILMQKNISPIKTKI